MLKRKLKVLIVGGMMSSSIMFTSCTKEDVELYASVETSTLQVSQEATLEQDYQSLLDFIKSNNITSARQFTEILGKETSQIRSMPLPSISEEAQKVVDAVQAFDQELKSLDKYKEVYLQILDGSSLLNHRKNILSSLLPLYLP